MAKAKEENVNGKASDEQIEAFKKMYGDVYEIQVEGHFCYVKGFDRTTMKLALSRMKMKIDIDKKETEIDMEKMLEIGEIGLQNGWLAGSEDIKQKDRLWIAASMQVGELFDLAETSLKKL